MNFHISTEACKKVSSDFDYSAAESEIIRSLLEQEERFGESHLGGKNRIALFDLDNTLVHGDVGDAVYTQMLIDGFPLPLSWNKYKDQCKKDPEKAYIEIVQAMEGITLEYLIQVTKRVLYSEQDFMIYEGQLIRFPKPNVCMKIILRLLQDWHYSLYIISATNDISAKITGSVLFDVPINNIAGIEPAIINKKLTHHIFEPIPIGVGKIAQYRLMAEDRMPMIVATDSELDYPLFDLCDPDGTAIIVGDNNELMEKAKRELPRSIHLHQIPDYS